MKINTAGVQVTILVPNYKTPMITKICMRLLRQHTDFSKARVIAIDNDSGDESLEYLKTLDWIDLIERPREADDTPPLSHARALDLALARVETPYVMTIHTDTFIRRPEWLDVLLEPFQKNPDLAGVGSWKLETKTLLQRWGKKIEGAWQSLFSREKEAVSEDELYLRSHCAIYRMDVIRKLGTGFSDGEGTAGSVMHRKMKAAGYQMLFLEAEFLGQYLDHLNHATMILNPELGSRASSIRKGSRNLKKKLRGFDVEKIMANEQLDK